MSSAPGGAETRPATAARPIALTDREKQVLCLIAWGYSNKQIAGRLGMSVRTIETFKSRGQAKIKVRGRTELVRYALRRGWRVEGGEYDPAAAREPDARRGPAADGLPGGGATPDCNAG